MRFQYALAFILVFVGGCRKAPDITGRWQSGMGGAISTYHFGKDGSYEFESLYDGMHAVSKGKYHFEGQQVVMEPTEANVEGANPRVDEYRAMTKQTSRLTIAMKGPDMFQLGAEQPPLILTRISREP